ncbi:flavodoxin family protein [Endozoicomonadaceae bacterium StTr2]
MISPQAASRHKITVVYHSGYGHTEVLARSVALGAKTEGAKVATVNVADLNNIDWEQLGQSDALIFGSPTYMGSVSGPFKMFMDESSKVWFQRGWENKIAAGFTTSAAQSGDKLNTLIQMSVFAAQHGMIWVGLGILPGNNSSTGSEEDLNRIGSFLGAMAQSNADEGADVAPPKSDHLTAQELGKRVAKAVVRWQ